MLSHLRSGGVESSRHGAARTREGSDGRGTWKGMALHPPSHRSPCWGRSLGSLALNADSFGWQVTGALILFGDGAHVPDVRCQQPASCVGDGGGCNCMPRSMGVPLKGSGCAYLLQVSSETPTLPSLRQKATVLCVSAELMGDRRSTPLDCSEIVVCSGCCLQAAGCVIESTWRGRDRGRRRRKGCVAFELCPSFPSA